MPAHLFILLGCSTLISSVAWVFLVQALCAVRPCLVLFIHFVLYLRNDRLSEQGSVHIFWCPTKGMKLTTFEVSENSPRTTLWLIVRILETSLVLCCALLPLYHTPYTQLSLFFMPTSHKASYVLPVLDWYLVLKLQEQFSQGPQLWEEQYLMPCLSYREMRIEGQLHK